MNIEQRKVTSFPDNILNCRNSRHFTLLAAIFKSETYMIITFVFIPITVTSKFHNTCKGNVLMLHAIALKNENLLRGIKMNIFYIKIKLTLL